MNGTPRKKVTFSDVYMYHSTYAIGSDFRKYDLIGILWKQLEKQKNEVLLQPILTEERGRIMTTAERLVVLDGFEWPEAIEQALQQRKSLIRSMVQPWPLDVSN